MNQELVKRDLSKHPQRPSKNSRRIRSLLCIATLLFVVCLLTNYLQATDDKGQRGEWLQEHVLNNSRPPFSFIYGSHASDALLKSWPRQVHSKALDAGRTEHTVVWTDPESGLQVRLAAIEFANSPVVEWTAYFKNNGKRDSPILRDVEALDFSFLLKSESIPTILYSRGCDGMDTYALEKKPLNQLESLHLSNERGAKNLESIPFFDLLSSGDGLIGAVGWPGKWAIDFSRPTEAAIKVTAGMETIYLSLHPGEEIRTPEILLLPWHGDDLDAHNVLRHHILKYHTPQYDGQPVVPPISHLGWGGMKTSTSLRLIDEISKENLGFDTFWMDAGWYGPDRPVEEFQVFGREEWFMHAGDWRINKVPHPDGLRPISDAAHAHGMKYLLWFEPERAVVGTPLTIQHPDWFIGEEGTNFIGSSERPWVKFRLFNFGNAAAREYMTNFMSDFITQQGIDIFRQDCNFTLAPLWAQVDTPGRKGITEIRYVEGLLQFWDELRRRHPQLILDIAQRTDLETISRGVDLVPSDYAVSPDADPIANQLSTEGLEYWRPHFGTLLQIRPRDNYQFRSGFAPGMSFALFNVAGTPDEVGSFIPPNFPFDWLRTMIRQLKEVRPYYYGDYYPLLPCSSNSDCVSGQSNERSANFEWAAWQFNRPEQGDGMVQAFRRPQSGESAKDLRLRGLDPLAAVRSD